MAKLSDKQKAAAILGDVEGTPVETPIRDETGPAPEEQQTNDEIEPVEEKSELEPEEEEVAAANPPEEKEPETETKPFTKQFPNLKGETAEEYLPELEKAYDNSFKEALRLKKENDEMKATVAQAQQVIAQVPTQTPPPPAEPTPTVPAPASISTPATLAEQRILAMDTTNMFAAFDEFTKSYPQARNEQEFADFQKVSNGVNQALTDRLGRTPTWLELYQGIAGTLSWQPTTPTPTKDAVIKDAGVSSHTNSTTLPPAKRPKVSDAQIDAYQKMFTSKTREDAIKDLSEVVA
jgi:hypothetical protein